MVVPHTSAISFLAWPTDFSRYERGCLLTRFSGACYASGPGFDWEVVVGRKKKVEEISEPVVESEVPRVRLVRPAAYAEIRGRGVCGGSVCLRADGRVDIYCEYSSPPTVTTGDLREALALLDAAELVRQ